MLYFLLGILAVIGVHTILLKKQMERRIKINRYHMIVSALFSIYTIFLIEFLHDRKIHMNYELLNIFLIYVPIGIAMPLIYQRYKYFIRNVIYVVLIDLYILILQNFSTGKHNSLMILFSLLGLLFGYFICTCINHVYPELRKSLILKKRRKKIVISLYEIETITVCFVVLFSMIAAAEQVSGKNTNKEGKESVHQTSGVPQEEGDRYSHIYYADADKYDRYDAYAKKNPRMPLEEVVWRVDANLDQEFYDEKYIKYADENTDTPLLINKFNRVEDDFEPDELVALEGDYIATPQTVAAYQKLTDDMEELGMKIYVCSSYRSVNYQDRLYRYYLKTDSVEEVDTYSSRPGFSEHHTGRAIDVSQVYNKLEAFEGSDEALWLYANAYKYGFIVRYKDDQTDVTGYIFEPWHIVYVGEEISNTMHDEKIETLEEYVVKYVDHHKT